MIGWIRGPRGSQGSGRGCSRLGAADRGALLGEGLGT